MCCIGALIICYFKFSYHEVVRTILLISSNPRILYIIYIHIHTQTTLHTQHLPTVAFALGAFTPAENNFKIELVVKKLDIDPIVVVVVVVVVVIVVVVVVVIVVVIVMINMIIYISMIIKTINIIIIYIIIIMIIITYLRLHCIVVYVYFYDDDCSVVGV